MPYTTGATGSFAALRATLVAACVAAGWTAAGDVIHKGGVFVELVADVEGLSIAGGTGIDGSNVLTGVAPDRARIGPVGAHEPSFPMTYHLHVFDAPDEIYLVVNYGVDFWQYIAFGRSDVAGVPGTGGWFAASMRPSPLAAIALTPSEGGGWVDYQAVAMFFGTWYDGNASVHHGFESEAGGWGLANIADRPGNVSAAAAVAPRYARLPSAFNSSDVLLPFQVYARRPDNKQSLVLDLAHARLVRMDNHQPTDLVGASPDLFRAYPWFRRDLAERDGGSNIMHTGTLGWAVRHQVP
ncbi:hypothetical protein [Luteimonas fraxinea]|uniref:Uncharacterized protein n=1 Tax=Luteimonas fraxinea TaxID=2901869 RepID=A0ABS8UE97_9GAMM|nr:hypothetical protein [Luteimonas fraxinea]MCD9097039.1 hypothetical protein [Luteimonas fraxinea]